MRRKLIVVAAVFAISLSIVFNNSQPFNHLASGDGEHEWNEIIEPIEEVWYTYILIYPVCTVVMTTKIIDDTGVRHQVKFDSNFKITGMNVFVRYYYDI